MQHALSYLMDLGTIIQSCSFDAIADYFCNLSATQGNMAGQRLFYSEARLAPGCLGGCVIRKSNYTYSVFYNRAWSENLSYIVRKIHTPSKPYFRYDKIAAIVIKDRSPMGKFKCKASTVGIVTVLIRLEGLLLHKIHNDLDGKVAILSELNDAIISHLDDNVTYIMTIVYRKGKYNIKYNHSYISQGVIVTKDKLKNNFIKIIDLLRKIIKEFLDQEVKNYRERLINVVPTDPKGRRIKLFLTQKRLRVLRTGGASTREI
jgi:hypothetical protein